MKVSGPIETMGSTQCDMQNTNKRKCEFEALDRSAIKTAKSKTQALNQTLNL